MKKQLLFAALAAALLAGCSKTEVGMSDAPATHISAKAAGAESPETKAPLPGTSFDGKQAQVFTTTSPLEAFTGDKTQMFTSAYASGVMTFRDNSYVQYDATGLNGNMALPADKSEVYLYGFYPTGWTTASAGAYESLSHTFDGKTDLMATWLTAADQQKIAYQGGAAGTTADKADLLFRHILTRYNVQVKCSDADAQTTWGSIQSIKLKNANIDNVSTGTDLGYTYSAGGGEVSFYKLTGTTATPAYSDELFEKATFADMLALTTTYQPACYTMAAPVDVDTDPATAELTLVVETLDKDGGKKKTAEVPLSFDRAQLAAAVLPNNTSGYSITVALNFRAGMIEASSVVEAWKNGGEQTEPVTPLLPPAIGDAKDGGIVYWVDPVDDTKYKVFSLDQGTSLAWAAQTTYVLGTPGQSPRDGKANVAAMKDYSRDNTNNGDNTKKTSGVFATDFPAAEFCDRKNTGGVTDWYLPARDELVALYQAYTTNKDVLDKAIKDNSGTDIPTSSDVFWSSTEHITASSSGNTAESAWTVFFSMMGDLAGSGKDDNNFVRCVKSTVPVPPVAIGDTKDGGIVYWVDPVDDTKYKVFSLDQGTSLTWAAQNTYELGTPGQSPRDGKANVAAIKAYFTANTATVGSDFSVAFPAAAFCDAKNTGGVTDWYLPAKDELVAFYTAYTDPANKDVLDKAITDNSGADIADGHFWSSTEDSSNANYAWRVFFSTGGTYSSDKGYDNYVRCVKSTVPVPPVAIGDTKDGGIVYWVDPADATNYKVFSLDEGSSLTWAANNSYEIGPDGRNETDGKANVAAIKAYFTANTATVGSDFSVAFPAAAFCDAKNTGGVTDWYLPAKDELVAFYTAYTDPANKDVLDKAITDNSGADIASGGFWSSTEDSNNTNTAWRVSFSFGNTYSYDKGIIYSVRCVRDL